MLVRFRTNLGSIDATALGVPDFTLCKAGAEVDLPEQIAEQLVARGVAVACEVPAPPKVKGVSKKPAITAPEK